MRAYVVIMPLHHSSLINKRRFTKKKNKNIYHPGRYNVICTIRIYTIEYKAVYVLNTSKLLL